MNTNFYCLPTAIGSLPHIDVNKACEVITKYLKDIPDWPQLPRRNRFENMAIQFSEGLPGLVFDNGRAYVDHNHRFNNSLQKLLDSVERNNIDEYAISEKYAAGLYCLSTFGNHSLKAIKGQITGPITLGLTILDETGRPIIYDETLAEAVALLLKLKAAWQEKQLAKVSPNTIIFVDEPYMGSFGSSFIQLSKQKVEKLIGIVFEGIKGLKGLHCCGNTDWPVLLNTQVDIISYDAYNYSESLSLYPAEVKEFLNRGGAIAWGIVPIDSEHIIKENVSNLLNKFDKVLSLFTKKGIKLEQLIKQSLITPSCALAPLADEASATRALKLLTELSKEIRRKYQIDRN